MIPIDANRLPLAATIRMNPGDQGRQVILLKPCHQKEPFSGVTKMQVANALTPDRIVAVARVLAADFVVALTFADPDLACDTYLDLCDLLAETRAAARREPALATGDAA